MVTAVSIALSRALTAVPTQEMVAAALAEDVVEGMVAAKAGKAMAMVAIAAEIANTFLNIILEFGFLKNSTFKL